jgi:hypothetical protein
MGDPDEEPPFDTSLYVNVIFGLINEALDYSPRMTCSEPVVQPQASEYPYSGGVFEANEEDVPPPRFG